MVSNMVISPEPRALHKLQAIHERGGVVVVDPRRTETARRFEHVAVRPDSDAWLLAAMLNHIFARELEARELLETRTAGWTDLRAALRPLTPAVADGRCGIEPGTLPALAERSARPRPAPCSGRAGPTIRLREPPSTRVLVRVQ